MHLFDLSTNVLKPVTTETNESFVEVFASESLILGRTSSRDMWELTENTKLGFTLATNSPAYHTVTSKNL
jgi:hypothetical protein